MWLPMPLKRQHNGTTDSSSSSFPACSSCGCLLLFFHRTPLRWVDAYSSRTRSLFMFYPFPLSAKLRPRPTVGWSGLRPRTSYTRSRKRTSWCRHPVRWHGLRCACADRSMGQLCRESKCARTASSGWGACHHLCRNSTRETKKEHKRKSNNRYNKSTPDLKRSNIKNY